MSNVYRQTFLFASVNDDGTTTEHRHHLDTEVQPTGHVVEYRRCRRHRHRTFNAESRCLFRYAAWVSGEGQWATLAGCGVLTIILHRSEHQSRLALGFIETCGCGHRCPASKSLQRHRLVYLGDKATT